MKTFTKSLETVLTKEEIDAHAVAASKAHARAEHLKAEARELTKAAKELNERVDAGRETREVKCHEVPDFAGGVVRTERLDEPHRWPDGNGTVETRDMTAEDRQLSTDGKRKGRS